MPFATLHKRIVYVIAGLGLFALTLGGEMAPIPMLLVACGYVGSWWCESPRIDSPRWTQGWTLALLALVVIALVRGWAGESPLALALEVSAALQVSRLANRRTATEHQQIVLLALLHLCASTVLSADVTWALPFLGFVLVVPWALALGHLRGEIETHFRSDAEHSREGALARVLASRRVVGGSFLAGIAALSIPIFAFTALLFLLFPRVGFGVLAFGPNDDSTLVGYDDEIELGHVGTLRADPTVVMRVAPPGGSDVPTDTTLRMRGTSFDHYDGRRWSRELPASPRALHQLRDTFVIRRAPGDQDELWDIVLDHFEPTVLFLLPGSVALEVPPRIRGGVTMERAIGLSTGLDIRYDDDEGIGLHYGVWVDRHGPPPLAPGLTSVERDAYLQIPPGHEALAELARAWTEGARDDRERITRITDRLRGGEFTYSLTMQDPGEAQPLVAFVTDHRTGHCEYFASAAVIMLRAVGVPARNVNGFVGGRWNPYGGYWAITGGDAHAWAEAFVPGDGWMTVEPSPPARGDIDVSRWWDGLAALFDALDTRWQEAIVEWDLGAQRTLLRRVMRLWRVMPSAPAPRAADDAAPRPEDDEADGALPVSGWWLALVAALAAALAWWRWRHAAHARTEPVPREVREVVDVYLSLERVLAARGRPRARSTTPLEHARALERDAFGGAADVRTVTERYLAVRFGGAAITATEIATLRRKVDAIARAGRPGMDRGA